MSRSSATIVACVYMVGLGAGCATTRYTEPVQEVDLVQAQDEIPETQLIDVGIEVFNSGIPEDEAAVPEGVYPEVRRAEARYIPIHLKETMQETGQWGAVRVLPTAQNAVDLSVSGTIIVSDGLRLAVSVRAVDATGRVWLDKRYKEIADNRAYSDKKVEDREPFQNLYNRICNDLLEAREDLDAPDPAEVRRVAELKFAADLAPVAFADYLAVDRKGRYSIERLPAKGDPMMERVAHVREREYMFVDTLNEHYGSLYARMEEPYDSWRKYSFEEEVSLAQLRRKATTQKILGAVALLGAMFADVGSSSQAAVRDLAALGGMAAIQAGMATSQEAKIHREAIKELGASFDAEVEPLVIEVEGQVLRLSGSAETQYETWRRLLREIYASETGLPVDLNTDGRAPPDKASGEPGR